MQQPIFAYHKDEHDDWVAELECGHFQHVRHKPPFINRPWVESAEDRNSMIGFKLECKKCDSAEPIDSN